MRISIREALFGGEELDDWEAPILSRFELFGDEGISWSKLVEAHPDIFSVNAGELERVDGKRISWVRIYRDEILYKTPNSGLGRESSYLYDTETQTVIFNHDARAEEKLEDIYPLLEKAIDEKTDISIT